MTARIVEFLRKKDLVFVKELGQGACGKTVILHDEVIDERFVCKKYAPIYEPLKEELFENFVREIKLLHLLNHPNVVRVFNYYLYPDRLTGYILMELIEGNDIEEYLLLNPEKANQVFLQTVDGFQHLEKNGILHRDIRPQNILVSEDGVVKIIDFGFGKRIATKSDFDKSITLNWWCEPPLDFVSHTYNFKTEVYFIGRLFEKIILESGVEQFAYKNLLSRMCASDPSQRIESFDKIKQEILAGKFNEIKFSNYELSAYRSFANDLSRVISKVEQSTKYHREAQDVERKLEDAYRLVMLEEVLPNNSLVIQCFLNGAYYYSNKIFIEVENLRKFVELLRSSSREKKNIILSNIYTRLDNIQRYMESNNFDDDIPF
ncbi:protein kinase family protein [Chrysiogenes arsenatis]|uniref:protein kinase family protein n=1 Tax=Chrysiogenes arsenatis TaxID=309797 RepID=UPI0004180756|nr:protein kinase family protein [Chrysiogenes arsenatis]